MDSCTPDLVAHPMLRGKVGTKASCFMWGIRGVCDAPEQVRCQVVQWVWVNIA